MCVGYSFLDSFSKLAVPAGNKSLSALLVRSFCNVSLKYTYGCFGGRRLVFLINYVLWYLTKSGSICHVVFWSTWTRMLSTRFVNLCMPCYRTVGCEARRVGKMAAHLQAPQGAFLRRTWTSVWNNELPGLEEPWDLGEVCSGATGVVSTTYFRTRYELKTDVQN